VSPPPQASDGRYDHEVVLGDAKITVPDAVEYGTPQVAHVYAVLVIDRSGSMGYSGYLEPAKTAASNFVTAMDNDDMVGVVSFDHYSY